jgi:hypothetical protein
VNLPGRIAAVCAALSTTIALSACGGDDVVERPAHRPISVIYVAGDPAGPWAARTEGLADGVKLAIADRDGLIGERAVSIAVVPVLQRDGTNVSASIGAGRIVRDSRAIGVLGAYTAPEAGVAVPQFNGGEIAFLQFGSGMEGLIKPEQPGEPGRYQVSGQRFELRGTPGDELVGKRAASISALRQAQVVAVTTTYGQQQTAAADARAKLLRDALAEAKEKGDDPLPSTSPSLTNPSPETPDADRLAAQLAESVQGQVVKPGDLDPSKPTIVVTDPTEPDPTTAARSVLATVRGAALVVDGADRAFDPAVIGRGRAGRPTYEIRRTIADAGSGVGRSIRAAEREAFGRDRGDAVVAGYLAAQRILELGANQPERTIDRVTFARALVAPAPRDFDLRSDAEGNAVSGGVKLFRLQGSSWSAVDGDDFMPTRVEYGINRPGARPSSTTP